MGYVLACFCFVALKLYFVILQTFVRRICVVSTANRQSDVYLTSNAEQQLYYAWSESKTKRNKTFYMKFAEVMKAFILLILTRFSVLRASELTFSSKISRVEL